MGSRICNIKTQLTLPILSFPLGFSKIPLENINCAKEKQKVLFYFPLWAWVLKEEQESPKGWALCLQLLIFQQIVKYLCVLSIVLAAEDSERKKIHCETSFLIDGHIHVKKPLN